jgi:hypothetical protein
VGTREDELGRKRNRESTTRVKEDQSPIEIEAWVRQNDDEGAKVKRSRGRHI